jgi:hypothetical protein
MPYQLRFKVALRDRPEVSGEDPVMCVDFEPAEFDDNLRILIRSRINREVMMRDVIELIAASGIVPLNYWPADPMDVCKGEFNQEIGDIVPKGFYKENGEWVPDLIVASAQTLEALIESLLDDDLRVDRQIDDATHP